MPLAYDPSDPSRARLDDLFHLHPASGTMLLIAVILLVVILVLSTGPKCGAHPGGSA